MLLPFCVTVDPIITFYEIYLEFYSWCAKTYFESISHYRQTFVIDKQTFAINVSYFLKEEREDFLACQQKLLQNKERSSNNG